MASKREFAAAAHRFPACGFTFVELIITVLIMAIVASIALPSFRELITRRTVNDNANTLIGALNSARAEAVKRGRPAALIAVSSDWNKGWQVVVSKDDGSGGVEPVPTSPGSTASDCAGDIENGLPMCMLHRGALAGGYTILAAGNGGGGTSTEVVFRPTGALASTSDFDFSVCLPSDQADPSQSRRIHVAASGIVTSHRDTSGSPAGSCS